MPFDREKMKKTAAQLAAKGIFVGTSSWRYEGSYGQLYTPARYEYRGKVAKTRFERERLSEYAEAFKTVSANATFHNLPPRAFARTGVGSTRSWGSKCCKMAKKAANS